jgi:mono/diheme cytochrome c family protein
MTRARLLVLVLAGLLVAAIDWLGPGLGRHGDDGPAPPPAPDPTAQIARGAYLARAGNCSGCHSARGGDDFAGGKPIETPFGTVYASNLTRDDVNGLGRWDSTDFWNAMHHGRSRDGRLLTPAFPFTNMTRVTREDSDAIFAWLQTLPAVSNQPPGNTLPFPFNTQAAMVVWRALNFRPGVEPPAPERSELLNRGAYLVRGLGHCEACHAPHNLLGAVVSSPFTGLPFTSDPIKANLVGGWLPGGDWYAPSLQSTIEAGVASWSTEEIIALLRDGRHDHATVSGPMAKVVLNSTQWLTPEDLLAVATYLKSLPPVESPPRKGLSSDKARAVGQPLYEQHCADCHGISGNGEPGRYPALAGNRAVTLPVAANVVQVVMHGGYAPGTVGNPRPYGMAPYAPFLNDAEVAAVVSYIRGSWGNTASAVDAQEVGRFRRLRAD